MKPCRDDKTASSAHQVGQEFLAPGGSVWVSVEIQAARSLLSAQRSAQQRMFVPGAEHGATSLPSAIQETMPRETL